MACVCEIAQKYGIDVSATKIKINPGGRGYFGETLTDGTIVLTPRAFGNEEQLARTIVHEQVHVGQIAGAGGRRPLTVSERDAWEDEAHEIEDAWWANVGSALR